MEQIKQHTINNEDYIHPNSESAELGTDYRHYWSSFLDSNPGICREYAGIKPAIRHTNKWMQRMDKVVKNKYDDTERCHAQEVTNWYYRLGSMNELQGAENRLLQAGMIMERRTEDPESSGRDKLVAGCLFHEAAALIGHPDNSGWLDRALDHYDQIISDDTIPEFNINNQMAVRHSYDIFFQQLFDRSHQLRSRGVYDYSDLEYQYRRLQQSYADEFMHLCSQSLKRNVLEEGSLDTFKGNAFEWFSVLAYRHAMWRKNKLGSATIRSAFPREDSPTICYETEYKTHFPKHGLDVVINKYRAGQLYNKERIQLKAGKNSNKYIPGIKTIGARSGGTRDFIEILAESAELMKKHYSGEYLNQQDHQTIQNTMRIVQPSLVERAA